MLAAAPPADLPTVHQAHGTADAPRRAADRGPPRAARLAAERLAWIARQLRAMNNLGAVYIDTGATRKPRNCCRSYCLLSGVFEVPSIRAR